MTKIIQGSPQNQIFVYDSSKVYEEPGCIRLFIMKDQTSAWEHALSINEAFDLAEAIQSAISEHNVKYQKNCDLGSHFPCCKEELS